MAPILGVSGFARTMAIKALVISGPDPGAIPGGSTISPALSADGMGPTSIDGRVKKIAFARTGPSLSGHFLTANDNFAGEYAVAA